MHGSDLSGSLGHGASSAASSRFDLRKRFKLSGGIYGTVVQHRLQRKQWWQRTPLPAQRRGYCRDPPGAEGGGKLYEKPQASLLAKLECLQDLDDPGTLTYSPVSHGGSSLSERGGDGLPPVPWQHPATALSSYELMKEREGRILKRAEMEEVERVLVHHNQRSGALAEARAGAALDRQISGISHSVHLDTRSAALTWVRLKQGGGDPPSTPPHHPGEKPELQGTPCLPSTQGAVVDVPPSPSPSLTPPSSGKGTPHEQRNSRAVGWPGQQQQQQLRHSSEGRISSGSGAQTQQRRLRRRPSVEGGGGAPPKRATVALRHASTASSGCISKLSLRPRHGSRCAFPTSGGPPPSRILVPIPLRGAPPEPSPLRAKAEWIPPTRATEPPSATLQMAPIGRVGLGNTQSQLQGALPSQQKQQQQQHHLSSAERIPPLGGPMGFRPDPDRRLDPVRHSVKCMTLYAKPVDRSQLGAEMGAFLPPGYAVQVAQSGGGVGGALSPTLLRSEQRGGLAALASRSPEEALQREGDSACSDSVLGGAPPDVTLAVLYKGKGVRCPIPQTAGQRPAVPAAALLGSSEEAGESVASPATPATPSSLMRAGEEARGEQRQGGGRGAGAAAAAAHSPLAPLQEGHPHTALHSLLLQGACDSEDPADHCASLYSLGEILLHLEAVGDGDLGEVGSAGGEGGEGPGAGGVAPAPAPKRVVEGQQKQGLRQQPAFGFVQSIEYTEGDEDGSDRSEASSD